MDKIQEIRKSALKDFEAAKNLSDLENVRIKYLGRKAGELTKLLRNLKNLPLEERRGIGPLAQKFREDLENLIAQKTSN